MTCENSKFETKLYICNLTNQECACIVPDDIRCAIYFKTGTKVKLIKHLKYCVQQGTITNQEVANELGKDIKFTNNIIGLWKGNRL